jgi:hypothetical protein
MNVGHGWFWKFERRTNQEKASRTVATEDRQMQKEKLVIRVIDVPHGVGAEEVERLLNEPNPDEFYLASIVPGEVTGTPHVAHRVFYKRRAARKDEN